MWSCVGNQVQIIFTSESHCWRAHHSDYTWSLVESHYIRRLSQKVVDFCYNMRLYIRNSMKFIWSFYIHHIKILHKSGQNHSLEPLLDCASACEEHVIFLKSNSSYPNISAHSFKFRNIISHNALTLQYGTIQGTVLKIWNVCGHQRWFLLKIYHVYYIFYFSENTNVIRTVERKKRLPKNFG